jgi:hypothetical protein
LQVSSLTLPASLLYPSPYALSVFVMPKEKNFALLKSPNQE